MPCFVYSVEPYPGDKDSGRDREFARVKGHIVLIPGKTWHQLKPRYERLEQGLNKNNDDKSWVKSTWTGDQIAERLVEKYGHTGLVATRSENELVRNGLEKDAEKIHREWITSITEEYNDQRRTAIYTGQGLRKMTGFEKACFAKLNQKPPTDAELTAGAAVAS